MLTIFICLLVFQVKHGVCAIQQQELKIILAPAPGAECSSPRYSRESLTIHCTTKNGFGDIVDHHYNKLRDNGWKVLKPKEHLILEAQKGVVLYRLEKESVTSYIIRVIDPEGWE